MDSIIEQLKVGVKHPFFSAPVYGVKKPRGDHTHVLIQLFSVILEKRKKIDQIILVNMHPIAGILDLVVSKKVTTCFWKDDHPILQTEKTGFVLDPSKGHL